MTLDELQAKLRSLPEEGDAIIAAATAEKREMTDEEQIRIDAINAEMDECNTAVGKLKQRAEARRKIDETRSNESWLVGARSFSTPDKPLEDRNTYSAWPVDEAGQVFQAVRSFEVSSGRTLPSDMNADLRAQNPDPEARQARGQQPRPYLRSEQSIREIGVFPGDSKGVVEGFVPGLRI